MKQDLTDNPLYVTRDAPGNVLGFALVKNNTEHAAELVWLAVAEDHQRQGAGTALVNTVCTALKAKGLKLLLVKTLSKGVHYAPYDASRHFFKKAGFVHIDTLNPCPGWEPGNPCDVYAMIL